MSQACPRSLLADATRAARLRLWIVVVGLLVIVVFAGSSAYDSWRSYRHVITANNRELGNLAKLLAEQAEDTLQTPTCCCGTRWPGTKASAPGPGGPRMTSWRLERPACRRCASSGSSTSTACRAFDRESCQPMIPPSPTGRISSLTGIIRVWVSF